MKITEMSIADAYRLVPEFHSDRRGYFSEAFRAEDLSEALGYPFVVGQGSFSMSRRNTLRGIHGTTLSPGQTRLVTCVRGAVMDVVIDLRRGSPTFGRFEATRLDEENQVALCLADGMGHAFLALTEGACMNYLLSTPYAPEAMIEINPLDPDIGVPWELTGTPIMSDKDAGAASLASAIDRGILSTYEECQAHYAALKAGSVVVRGNEKNP